MYVWLAAGQDLALNVETEPGLANFRFEASLKSPDHFNLVTLQVRPQTGQDSVWYNTTSWVAGNYYFTIDGPTCPTPPNYYNVTWTATPTGMIDDNDNSLASGTVITDGLSVTSTIAETFDQQDFFKIDVSFTPPTSRYLQISGYSATGSPRFEFYNATGAVEADPHTHMGLDANSTAIAFSTKAFRFPAPGMYYVRLWTAGQNSAYSLTFSVVDYTPTVSYLDFGTALTVGDDFSITNTQDYSFESSHYYKIFISTPRTIWVNASSNQIDLNARLFNESLVGTYFQKRFVSHPFDDLANPKDRETFNFTVTAGELAVSTGWYFIVVSMSSDLPPNGIYTLAVWLNDGPVGSSQSEILAEDAPLNGFDTQTLFSDLDCNLSASDPDCALMIALLNGTADNLTFDFDGSRWLNVVPAANWSGSGCRQFRAWDAKNLTALSILCVQVDAVNDPPALTGVAIARYTMLEDHSLNALRIASWFFDVDGDPLTYAVDGNTNISVTIDQLTGLADFVPQPDYNGFNNLTFTATDDQGLDVTIRVEFQVVAQNDAPEPRGALPQVVVDEDATAQLNLATVMIFGVQGAFIDIDGDALTYTISDELNVTVDVTGPLLVITPDPDFVGLASFSVVASDGLNQSSKVGVLVRVNPVNDEPVIASVLPTTNPTVVEGESRAFSVVARDVDGDTLSYQWYVDGTGVVAATRSDYTLATHVTDEKGRTSTVRVVASDGNGGTVEHEWTLTIQNKNQPPRNLAISSPTTFTFLTTDEITFSATASDPDDDTLTWTWNSDRLATPFGNEQTVTVKLPAGSHKIRLFVSDGEGSLNATVNVTVNEPAPPKGPGFEGPAVIAGMAAVAVAVLVGRRRRAAP
jgi:hypothetical protein